MRTEEPEVIHWWERANVQIEAQWRLYGQDLASWYRFRRWLVSADGAIKLEYHGRKVVWIRGNVKLLGLTLGAGMFVFVDTTIVPLPRR